MKSTAHAEHEWEDDIVKKIVVAFKEYRGSDKQAASSEALLKVLKLNLPSLINHILAHLRNEEEDITPVVRKYFPIELQKKLVNEAYAVTSGDEWNVILPFVVKNLPMLPWKVKFIQCFVWADPNKAQELGLALYKGLDDTTWAFLTEKIPQLIPKGLHGYKKIW
jgi:hypothetical protein